MTAFDFGDSDPLDAYDEGDEPAVKAEILQRITAMELPDDQLAWAQEKLEGLSHG